MILHVATYSLCPDTSCLQLPSSTHNRDGKLMQCVWPMHVRGLHLDLPNRPYTRARCLLCSLAAPAEHIFNNWPLNASPFTSVGFAFGPKAQRLRNTSEQWPFPCCQLLTRGRHRGQARASLQNCLLWAVSLLLGTSFQPTVFSCQTLCRLSPSWDISSSPSPPAGEPLWTCRAHRS